MIVNVAASVRQRLFNEAKKRGEDFQRTLVRFAIERFLYRLSLHAARNRFILKGAMLFITWPEIPFRPSGDLDLLGHGASDTETMKTLVREICQIADDQDGLVFDVDTLNVQILREAEEYNGIRATLTARLEQARIPLQIDIGFGDVVYPEAKRIEFPCLLDGMPEPSIYAYPPETVIAEKFEALVRFGEATSRVKDLYDIWAISTTFRLEKATLAEAMQRTLKRRETPAPTTMPFALSEAFAALPAKRSMWTAFVGRSGLVNVPPLDELLSQLRAFLGPVIASFAIGSKGAWTPTVGWSE